MGPAFYWSRLSVLLSEVVLLGFALAWLTFGAGRVRTFGLSCLDALRSFAARSWAAPCSVGVALILLRIALLPWYPVPEPVIHDEFSVILGAQTFALGRLANPAHPLWRFFDTFHVLQQPTYCSIYPPAQALLLAAGIWAGHPWIAVVAASALMCAVFVWMLRAWFSPVWSLCGGVLLLFQVGMASYWTNSYWGGSLAALAGAVLVGSAGRIWTAEKAQTRYSVLAAIAIVVLFNRRPFEGGLLAAGITAATVYWVAKRGKRPLGRELLRLAIPALLVLVPCAIADGYYNFRATGDPLLMPYAKVIESQMVARHDILMAAAPVPRFQTPEARQLHMKVELDYFQNRRQHPIASLRLPLFQLWAFFFGPALTIPLLAIPLVWKDRRFKGILLILSGCLLVNLTETWLMPHYLSPELPLLWIVVVAGLERLYRSRRPILRNLATAAIFAAIAGNLAPIMADVAKGRHLDFSWERSPVVAKLEQIPGRHVVVVQYLPGHSVEQEFVYNDADIDASRIVWARDLGWERDRELLSYYHDRRIWLLRVGAKVESMREITPADRSAVDRYQSP